MRWAYAISSIEDWNRRRNVTTPTNANTGKEDERERVERPSEPGQLGDEGQRDQVAGQGSEIDAGAPVGFRDG